MQARGFSRQLPPPLLVSLAACHRSVCLHPRDLTAGPRPLPGLPAASLASGDSVGSPRSHGGGVTGRSISIRLLFGLEGMGGQRLSVAGEEEKY